MDAEQVEQMLYEHAIRTKIRAPIAERAPSLGYNRVVSGGVVAGAALICTLAIANSGGSKNDKMNLSGATIRPQIIDADQSLHAVYSAPTVTDHRYADRGGVGLAISRTH